ncbi:glycoside hydrolase family 32 protein [Faecalimicrobium sp. JNUCC 81]
MSILKKEFSKLIDMRKGLEKDKVNNDEFRLKYHLMPPIGWLNDPNGLCQFKGEYHIFYQYSPFEAKGGLKFWGHYKSKDLINWNDMGAQVYPDNLNDCHGVYSGSAFVENNKIYFYYTGNVKEVGDFDYINKGRQHNTIMFKSNDGINFTDKKLIFKNIDYPENMTCHVRDPKVFKKDNNYYMILGARDKNDKGCILLYKSSNLEDWSFVNIITSDEKFGYMWECPDMFELTDKVSKNTKTILCISPQGIEKNGHKYNNIYQSGYFLGNMNLNDGKYDFKEFTELDRGFDFYAPQTFIDEKNRNILIGWMGLPDIDDDYYTNPTVEFGWQHALTIPRVLELVDNKIYQRPIDELKELRKSKITKELNNVQVYDELKAEVFELDIEFDSEVDDFKLELREDCKITFNKDKKLMKLTLGNSGYGRESRAVDINELRKLQIFSDTSSLEIFVNDGEEVFTTRIYPKDNKDKIVLKGNLDNVKINLYELGEYRYV